MMEKKEISFWFLLLSEKAKAALATSSDSVCVSWILLRVGKKTPPPGVIKRSAFGFGEAGEPQFAIVS
jgi:hypothetical protein